MELKKWKREIKIMMTKEEQKQFIRAIDLCTKNAAIENLLALVIDLIEKTKMLERKIEQLDSRTISMQRIG